MYKAMLKFYWSLLCIYLLPAWLFQTQPDAEHFHRRRFTPKYRSKQRIVWYLWGAVALLVIFIPAVPIAVFSFLLASFLSFAILDESA